MARTHTAIAPVETQPSQYKAPLMTNLFITSWRRDSIMSNIITGTARTPLMTALQ